MKYTLNYTFSLLLVLVSFVGTAQEAKIKDSITPKKERYGIRFGIDVAKLARTFYEKDYRGLELVGDYKLTRRHYIAVELGNENKTVDDDQLNFTTEGTYIKAGFDYNAYKNWVGMENMIYVGMRYGVSSFSQTLNNYQIYNPNTYFGENQIIEPGEKYDGLSAQWVEVVAGIKAEVFKNVYVGFSFRVNYLVSNKKPENFDNLHIPGFNRTYNGDFGAGFNYTVSYFLPLYKSTIKEKSKKKKN
jgi:Domain of unknown function (DUF6048)